MIDLSIHFHYKELTIMATTNCEMFVAGTILTIKIDLSKEHGASSSGKSIVIGTTGGNISVPGKEEVKIGLNVYRKA